MNCSNTVSVKGIGRTRTNSMLSTRYCPQGKMRVFTFIAVRVQNSLPSCKNSKQPGLHIVLMKLTIPALGESQIWARMHFTFRISITRPNLCLYLAAVWSQRNFCNKFVNANGSRNKQTINGVCWFGRMLFCRVVVSSWASCENCSVQVIRAFVYQYNFSSSACVSGRYLRFASMVFWW